MMKFLIGPAILGLALTLASTLYKTELVLDPSFEPCVYTRLKIPLKHISYGLPTPWLTAVQGVYKYGCGPIISHYYTSKTEPTHHSRNKPNHAQANMGNAHHKPC